MTLIPKITQCMRELGYYDDCSSTSRIKAVVGRKLIGPRSLRDILTVWKGRI